MITGTLTGRKNFSYVNARVRARRGDLITDQEYRKLVKMDIPGIAEFLGKRGYEQEMEELGADHEGEDLIAAAVRQNLARTYRELMDMSPDPVQELLDVYFRKFDIENIKMVLRAVHSGEEVEGLLVPTREFDAAALERLAGMDSIEAVMDAVELDGLDGDIEEHLPDDPRLADMEDALDTHYYTAMVEEVEAVGGRSDLFRRFLETEAVLKNVSLVLRMKRRGHGYEDIVDRLIPVPARADIDPEELAALDTVDEIVDRLADALDGVELGDRSPAEVQRALETYKLRQGIRLMHADQLGVNPVLGFMVCKEVEATNLRMLARATEAGLGDEFIERNLVEGVAS
ncbi:MAG: V-type ATPase subunit [Candidatus Nanohaloarchaea archaeon]|nr:V-type ATPase subunit [Candidatus Nanohaloarchaea archaeon]